jgi:2-polyprenyl-3-methyl-5-hydroxy-6-metoxy-1,4-benzoquinol methylase
MERKAHWETVYQEKDPGEVSWFQPRPETSLALIEATGAGADDAIVDVGGGASTLVDHLLAAGHRNVTVLDIAENALATSQQRLGDQAQQAAWICADATDFALPHEVEVWHDRAVFHFLTHAADRAAYRDCLHRHLAADGQVVVATFAPDGPEKCSGLPVMRYDPDSLAAELGLAVVESVTEHHVTPGGKPQSFVYVRLQRA